MTVGELIQYLSEFDPGMTVVTETEFGCLADIARPGYVGRTAWAKKEPTSFSILESEGERVLYMAEDEHRDCGSY